MCRAYHILAHANISFQHTRNILSTLSFLPALFSCGKLKGIETKSRGPEIMGRERGRGGRVLNGYRKRIESESFLSNIRERCVNRTFTTHQMKLISVFHSVNCNNFVQFFVITLQLGLLSLYSISIRTNCTIE